MADRTDPERALRHYLRIYDGHNGRLMPDIAMYDLRRALAELERLRALTAGIRELLGEVNTGGPCSFWACPGEEHPVVPMATCNVCAPRLGLRELLGDPAPECTALECSTCGKESPWCDPCDSKIIHCEHAPQAREGTPRG